MVWLILGTGGAFVLGFILQLLGARTLDEGEYGTFIFALGVGNVAAAIAGAVQPVVAVRAGTGSPAFLPAPPWVVCAAGAGLVILLTLALAPSVGIFIALLALLQIPFHALAGVGIGRLQGRRAFGIVAVALLTVFAVRIGVVMVPLALGQTETTWFVLGLPLALAVTAGLLRWRGAYRDMTWGVAPDARELVQSFALWTIVAWLVNGDAVFARLLLTPLESDAYGLAITIGRQPLYAVAPLAIVLLPSVIAGDAAGQRARLRAVVAVSALLFGAAVVILGGLADSIATIITGGQQPADIGLIRLYTAVGALAAAATLLLTFSFALGHAPRLRTIACIAAVASTGMVWQARDPFWLIAWQGATMVAVTAVSGWAALRAVSNPRTVNGRPGSPRKRWSLKSAIVSR